MQQDPTDVIFLMGNDRDTLELRGSKEPGSNVVQIRANSRYLCTCVLVWENPTSMQQWVFFFFWGGVGGFGHQTAGIDYI